MKYSAPFDLWQYLCSSKLCNGSVRSPQHLNKLSSRCRIYFICCASAKLLSSIHFKIFLFVPSLSFWSLCITSVVDSSETHENITVNRSYVGFLVGLSVNWYVNRSVCWAENFHFHAPIGALVEKCTLPSPVLAKKTCLILFASLCWLNILPILGKSHCLSNTFIGSQNSQF